MPPGSYLTQQRFFKLINAGLDFMTAKVLHEGEHEVGHLEAVGQHGTGV